MIISGIGRLGKDPSMSYTPKGSAQTFMNVATDSGFGDNKKTTWVSLVSWGALAELVNKYLQKGSRIHFVAEVTEIRMYEKNDGGSGATLDAKLLKVDFIDGIASGSEPEEF